MPIIETRRTKKVAGVDLSSSSFAYVGDLNDTATWRLPLHVPGDTPKTINLIKNALARFTESKGIPEAERQSVWLIIVGAAKAHGIPAQRQAPAPAKSESEKPAPFVVDADDAQLKESLALAALHRDKFLHSIGYGDT